MNQRARREQARTDQGRPAKLDYWLDLLRENVKQMSVDPLPFQPRLITIRHAAVPRP